MEQHDNLGFYRSIQPKNSFPQSAWKIDNDMKVRSNELLVNVKILNINLVSFLQILEETGGNKEKVSDKILQTIEERGKMHNAVTGTGGMLYGTVAEIGEDYPNFYQVSAGDEIISLVSLSVTPLKITKIIDIDVSSAQVQVVGQAILFANCPLIKKTVDLPHKILIAAFDEAGAPAQTSKLVQKGHDAIILGAAGKMGLLCAFAARDKIGSDGRIVGLVNTKQSRDKLESSGIFNEIICCDVNDTIGVYHHYLKSGQLYDVVINCLSISYTEIVSLLLVKNKGTVYFASMGSDSKVAGLTAEALGKDLTIVPYKGYVEGHAQLTLALLEKYQPLRELLEDRLAYKFTDPAEYIKKNEHQISAVLARKNTSRYIFESEKAKEVFRNAIKVAKFDCTVLIYGESGVGKENVAQIIHENSERSTFPYIKINCASIPEHLLESELFGYEKGAFTGADPKGRIGFWEQANNGILLLDEIGELPFALQSKILRAIQEKEIYRVGGTRPIKINVRIIAATNKNLFEMVKRREFREDLYYRLNVFPIFVPPLRDRMEDINPLITMYVKEYNKKFSINKSIDEKALRYLMEYEWPGNIRELQNFIQRIFIEVDDDLVTISDIKKIFSLNKQFVPFKEATSFQELRIKEPDSLKTLDKTEFEIFKIYKEKYKTTRKIAEALGTSQSSVVRKLKKHGLSD